MLIGTTQSTFQSALFSEAVHTIYHMTKEVIVVDHASPNQR